MIIVPATRVIDGLAAFAFVTDVAVAVTDVAEWTNPLLDRYLTELTTLAKRHNARGSLSRFLGKVPDSAQRRHIAEWLDREGLLGASRACVLTDSPVMRGALTAYAWLTNAEARAFATTDLVAASEYVCKGLDADPEKVHRAIIDCHALVGVRLKSA